MDQYSNSDPFPEGIVDTIYFDNDISDSYQSCFNGKVPKTKFRLRAHEKDLFSQLQIKSKYKGVVSKLKASLNTSFPAPSSNKTFHDFLLDASGPDHTPMAHKASNWGVLRPHLRIQYNRLRFRIRDERVTLDMNLRFEAYEGNTLCLRNLSFAEDSVLEIKTFNPSPLLPLLGVLPISPSSMSKFEKEIFSYLDWESSTRYVAASIITLNWDGFNKNIFLSSSYSDKEDFSHFETRVELAASQIKHSYQNDPYLGPIHSFENEILSLKNTYKDWQNEIENELSGNFGNGFLR